MLAVLRFRTSKFLVISGFNGAIFEKKSLIEKRPRSPVFRPIKRVFTFIKRYLCYLKAFCDIWPNMIILLNFSFFRKNDVFFLKMAPSKPDITKIFEVQNLKTASTYDSFTKPLCSNLEYYRTHKREPLCSFLSR